MGGGVSHVIPVRTFKCTHWTTDYAQCLREADLGDIIEIRYPDYIHCSIYIGGRDVIHMVINNKNKKLEASQLRAVIRRDSLKTQAKGNKVRVRNRDTLALEQEGYIELTPAEIVRRAKEEVGKVYQYGLFSKSSQEWTTRVRYGVAFSHTVDIYSSLDTECGVCKYS